MARKHHRNTQHRPCYLLENELMCWHYDHVSGRNVFELIKKPLQYCDMQTRQVKRMSEVSKNELMRQMTHACIQNELKFRYVLMDSWFASQENFAFITQRGKHFIAALKDNRLVALSEQDRQARRFTRVDELTFQSKAMCAATSRVTTKKSLWYAKSLHTRTAARQHCIWCAVT